MQTQPTQMNGQRPDPPTGGAAEAPAVPHQKPARETGAVKAEFVVERLGKTFVLYAGLLDLAHQQGLCAVHTTLVQIPNEMNGSTAIVIATVETKRGTFTGLGDASPTNVNRAMTNALIRLAETRAKARALRDAVNVGTVAVEELTSDEDGGDEDDEEYPSEADLQTPTIERRRQQAVHAARAEQERAARVSLKDPDEPILPQQVNAIAALARRLGKAVPTEGMTRGQAAARIAEMAAAANANLHAGRESR